MAYEVVIEVDPQEAGELIELYEAEGLAKVLEALRLYHWYGHHKIIADLEIEFKDGDVILTDGGPYVGYINAGSFEAGLFFKIPH
jgi:hypothetical protein